MQAWAPDGACLLVSTSRGKVWLLPALEREAPEPVEVTLPISPEACSGPACIIDCMVRRLRMRGVAFLLLAGLLQLKPSSRLTVWVYSTLAIHLKHSQSHADSQMGLPGERLAIKTTEGRMAVVDWPERKLLSSWRVKGATAYGSKFGATADGAVIAVVRAAPVWACVGFLKTSSACFLAVCHRFQY